jgi:hypothetical protein
MTRNVGRSRDLSISETFFTALSNPETHSSFCKHAMQNYSPLASYAIVEKGEAGWRVELLKVPYEQELAAEQALRQSRDDWAKWISTGRAGA